MSVVWTYIWHRSIFLYWPGVDDTNTTEDSVKCYQLKTSSELLELATAAQQFCRATDPLTVFARGGQPMHIIQQCGTTVRATVVTWTVFTILAR